MQVSAERHLEMNTVLADLCRAHHIPGAQVAVCINDRPSLASFGVLKHGHQAPVTTDSKFRIACLAKVVTAALALQLAERRMISLDEPICRYCPSLPLRGELVRLTLRNLLSHSSGLDASVELMFGSESPLNDIGQFVHAALPLAGSLSAPGSVFAYSTLDFSIAAYALERVAGLSWTTLAQQHVWQSFDVNPLAMQEPETSEGIAADHHLFGHNPRVREVAPPQALPFLMAADSLGTYISAAELMRFGHFLLKASRAPGSPWEELFIPSVSIPRHPLMLSAALGLIQFTNGAWGQIGNGKGHHALLALYPQQDIVVAIMTNSYSSLPLFWELTNYVVQVPLHSQPLNADELRVEEIAGVYVCQALSAQVVRENAEVRIRVLPTSPATFQRYPEPFLLEEIDPKAQLFVIRSPADSLIRGPVSFFKSRGEGCFLRINLTHLKRVS